jgi:tetratricopeptide (TPR) repeat protein
MTTLTLFLSLISVAGAQDDNLAALTRAAAENPTDFASAANLLETYVEQGNYDAADSVVRGYTILKGENAEALYLQARLLDLTEHIEQAMVKYRQAIVLDSTLWQACRDLAYLNDIFSNYENMKRLFGQAIMYAPVPGSLYYDYGYTFDMLGELDSAQYYYNRALAFDSLDHQACLNLSAIMGISGNLDSARYLCRKAIDINPDTPEGFYNLGEINLSLGLLDDAVASFKQALALESELFAAQKKLGEIYEIMGDSGMARIYFEEFIRTAPAIYIDDIIEIEQKLTHYK